MADENCTTKRCTKCSKEYPATLEYFHKDNHRQDKLTQQCKQCRGYRFLPPKQEVPNGYKRCPKCKQTKLATDEFFYKNSRLSYGLSSLCRDCCKILDATPKYQERRRLHHHELGIKETRLAKTTTPEFRAKRREYNKNPIVKDRIRKERATPHYRELSRIRRKKRSYLDKARIHASKRNTLKRALPFAFTEQQWLRALSYFDNRCAVCGRRADFWTILAQDHWIPLSDISPDNPGTVATNIVPLCHSRKGVPYGEPACNMSKRDKNALEWLIERFGKRKANAITKRIDRYFEWVKYEDCGIE